MAMLCLMRYEAWTFREAEVRLPEHHEPRQALGSDPVPDYTTLYRFLRGLEETVLEQLWSAVIQRLLPRPSSQTTVAVAATGLAPGAISTFFVKRVKEREPSFTWRQGLKWTMVVDLDRRLPLAQTTRRGPTNACATVRPLVSVAHERAPMGRVLADAEFDRERRHPHSRQVRHAQRVMPAKRGGAAWKIDGVQAQMGQEFSAALHRQRAFIESRICAAKGKLSVRAPSRSLATQCLQALLLGVAYNVYRL
jgi:Transposase domain (DUF772)